MIEYIVDTNVFLKVFKGHSDLAKFIGNLEIAIDTTIYIECIQGSKSNQDKRQIQKVIDNLPLIHITPAISNATINLIDTYSNSHGLLLADALIAASALENDLTVITYNVVDFKFIKGMKYLEPKI